MAKLILIKHAPPQVQPELPSDRWELSERGRALCEPLARVLGAHAPQVLIASREPKAVQTAEQLGRWLNLSHRVADGLHEHDRSNVPYMRSAEFISMMELFFRRPDEQVLGRETATQARQRFAAAVEANLADHPDQTVAIVAHGTVIALLVAQHGGRRAFELWRLLGLPSFVVMSRPEMRVEQIVERVDEPEPEPRPA